LRINRMLRVSVVCFLASYGLAFALELTRLLGRSLAGRWLSLGLTAAGLVAQTLFLLLRVQQTNLPPLLSSMQDWLLVLAWLMVLVHLFVSLIDRELATGFVIWPLVLGLIVASQFVSDSAGTAATAHRNWTMLHVALLIFGIAGVATGFVVSLLYLWQHRRLKHPNSGWRGLSLPSLERLARLNRWALLVSVPLLTFGMLIGVGLTLSRQPELNVDSAWTDPVVIVSGVCWLLMTGVFVWVLSGQRPQGRQVAWLTLWSCGFLLLTTVGAQVLAESIQLPAVHGTRTPVAPPLDDAEVQP
jgi:ABC-type uncharacterized transport system permease subunit